MMETARYRTSDIVKTSSITRASHQISTGSTVPLRNPYGGPTKLSGEKVSLQTGNATFCCYWCEPSLASCSKCLMWSNMITATPTGKQQKLRTKQCYSLIIYTNGCVAVKTTLERKQVRIDVSFPLHWQGSETSDANTWLWWKLPQFPAWIEQSPILTLK